MGLLFASASAFAADLTVKGPAALGYLDWSGAYVGVHVGYGGGMKDWTPLNSDFIARGPLGGLQVGFNKQLGSFVFGVEAEGAWSDISGTQTTSLDFGTVTNASVTRSRIDGLVTVAGRAGLAAGPWFVYSKAGFVVAHETHYWRQNTTFSFPGLPTRTTIDQLTNNEVRVAPMLGFGAEYALGGPWSLKGEYNFLWLGDRRLPFTDPATPGVATVVSVDQNIHLVKFGANYRFGRLASDPTFNPVPPAKGTDWSGVFVGAQAGYGFGHDFWNRYAAIPGLGNIDPEGWLAGLNGGVNVQAGVLVFGIEGEWMWTSIDRSKFFAFPLGSSVSFADRINWLAIASARAGFVVGDKLLLYGKAGVAIASERHSDVEITPGTVTTWASNPIHTGGVVGAGGEYALGGNWSVKAEYDYVRMLPQSSQLIGRFTSATLDTAFNVQLQKMPQDLHLVKFGVNYHFNSLQTLIAKY